MEVDVMRYILAYKGFVEFSLLKHDMPTLDVINIYSVVSGCPLIVTCYFAIKNRGDSEEIQNKIKQLTIFYKYETIKGVEEFLKGEENE